MRRLLVTAVLLTATLVAALPAHAATVRAQRFSGFPPDTLPRPPPTAGAAAR